MKLTETSVRDLAPESKRYAVVDDEMFRPSDNRPFTAENGPWHSDEVTALVNGGNGGWDPRDRKSTRLNSSHWKQSRLPSSA